MFFFQAEDWMLDLIVTCVQSFFFFFQAEDGIRDLIVTGVQTCALPILIVRPLLQLLSELACFFAVRSAESRSQCQLAFGDAPPGFRYNIPLSVQDDPT